ncbi:protein piccolo [Folsomia candida]|uniref:protein piccolo n=1 Tax=Folsomia candida TaxID=158441 RepID=UPI000B8F9005|nr:protein piccolo [Folsomia candida]
MTVGGGEEESSCYASSEVEAWYRERDEQQQQQQQQQQPQRRRHSEVPTVARQQNGRGRGQGQGQSQGQGGQGQGLTLRQVKGNGRSRRDLKEPVLPVEKAVSPKPVKSRIVVEKPEEEDDIGESNVLPPPPSRPGGGPPRSATATPTPKVEQLERRSSPSPSCQRDTNKYLFPVRRHLLRRNPHDTSLQSNGVGLKIVGGKETPDATGRLVAYVAKVFRDKVFPTRLGGEEIREGDVVLEWNGESLENKTFEEAAAIMGGGGRGGESEIQGGGGEDEVVELVIRSDYDIFTGKGRPPLTEEEKAELESRVLLHPGKMGEEDAIRRSSVGRGPYRHDEGGIIQGEDYSRHSTGAPPARLIEPSLPRRLVRSPSASSTETPTSTSTGPVHEGPDGASTSRFPQHLVIPCETDLRKRSTASLPPSLNDHHHMHQPPTGDMDQEDDRYLSTRDIYRGRKGSENISVKSMGISSPGEKPHGSSSRHRGKKGAYGQIQLQICHDPKANILYVTVIKARLPKQRRVSGAGGPGEEGGEIVVAENPYVTVFLLPERVLENQRRTRHVANVTLTPTWNQTMVYPNVTGEDLKDKYLEVAVRNYNPEGGVDALLGKIILYLSDDGILEEQPHSYSLRLEDKPYRRRSSQKSAITVAPTSRKSSSSATPRGSLVPTASSSRRNTLAQEDNQPES